MASTSRFAPVLILVLGAFAGPDTGDSAQPGAASNVGVMAPDRVIDQERTGSTVPCAVPMGWALGEVDSRFSLSGEEAEAALRAAFALWEAEIGRPLFRLDDQGHPIRFVYDDRQAAAQRQRADQEASAAVGRELDAARVAFEEKLARHRADTQAYEGDAAAHSDRTRLLSEEVRLWNERREIPDSVRARIVAEQEELAERGRALDRRADELRQRSRDLNEESAGMNERIAEFNRAQARLGSIQVAPTQAGRYDEEVFTRNGEVEDVRRRIRVFRFDSPADLIVVLAHELGHALGLGHTASEGAIMSEVSTSDPEETTPRLHPSDVELLDRTCPALRDDSPTASGGGELRVRPSWLGASPETF